MKVKELRTFCMWKMRLQLYILVKKLNLHFLEYSYFTLKKVIVYFICSLLLFS